MKKDLFGYDNQGKKYDIYRPRYPPEMLNKVLSKVKGRNSYLDVATGTGQILFQIAHSFKHSEGLDISKKMIQVCSQKIQQKNLNNISVKCQDFVKAKLDQKYDLITIGQALHWLPIKEFLEKSKISLQKEGVLAVCGYILNGVQVQSQNKTKQYTKLFEQFYDKKVKKNFDFDRDQLHTHYSNKQRYPFQEVFPKVTKQIEKVVVPMDKNGFLSYLKTFSGYNTYLERFPNEEDPIKPLMDNIEENAKLNCVFDYFYIVCQI